MAGAGGQNYMELWLLFRCKNSQERRRATVSGAAVRQSGRQPGGGPEPDYSAAELLLGQIGETTA
jgi:hypothetical protein